MRAVIGAMCTYHRPADLRASLDALDRQSRPLDHLVIVDNGSDRSTADLVAAHPLADRIPIDVVDPERNLGPAGGYRSAFARIERFATDDDLVVILDDDDPPPAPDSLEDLVTVAESVMADPTVAGVGLRGGRLDLRTGLIESRPRTETETVEWADHLHGGWLPTYRVAALREVDAFDGDLFWGFDDLELGRRLHRAGYTLRVAAESYRRISRLRARRPDLALAPPSWRHYYRHRNLLRVLRRERAHRAIVRTILIRLLAKPMVNLVRRPRVALWHLRTNADAIRDSLFSEARAIHPRHVPPAPEPR